MIHGAAAVVGASPTGVGRGASGGAAGQNMGPIVATSRRLPLRIARSCARQEVDDTRVDDATLAEAHVVTRMRNQRSANIRDQPQRPFERFRRVVDLAIADAGVAM
jgi:hypothetical protein